MDNELQLLVLDSADYVSNWLGSSIEDVCGYHNIILPHSAKLVTQRAHNHPNRLWQPPNYHQDQSSFTQKPFPEAFPLRMCKPESQWILIFEIYGRQVTL